MSTIQPGKYLARARGPQYVQFGHAKTGTEQIAVEFVLLDPETKEPTDTTITWIGNFANEKSLEITAKALKACGMLGDDLEDLTGIDQKVVELDVAAETYNGETRTRVKWVNTPGGGVVFKDRMGAEGKKAVSARMKGFLSKQGKAAAGGASEAADDGDQIPF